MVLICRERHASVFHLGSLAGVEILHSLTVIEHTIEINCGAPLRVKLYKDLLSAVIVSQCRMHIKCLLSAGRDHRVFPAYLSKTPEMTEIIRVYIFPVHIGAERLGTIYIIPGVAQSPASLVAIKYLGNTGSKQQSRGTINHIVHIGIPMVGIIEITERMPSRMRNHAVGISLPGVDNAIEVSMFWEKEIDHA